MLNRDSILERMATPKLERVEVPEWGNNGSAVLFVRPLTGAEYESLMLPAAQGGMSEKEAAARLCVAGTCDEHGHRIFKDEDWPLLVQSPFGWSAVLRCARAVARINNMEGSQDPLDRSGPTPGSTTGSG